MNKAIKGLVIVLTSIVGLWIMGRVTGIFQYYTCPTSSNEPTFKAGSKFFVSNLVKPERFDFICYSAYDPYVNKTITVFHRLCGMPGDVVEIKNGKLYVNNIYADAKFNLRHPYKISNIEFAKLPDEILNDEASMIQNLGDSSAVFLDDKWIRDNHVNAIRHFYAEPDSSIIRKFSMPWTADNFGPIQVPANNYFVLGDNRSNALDSRYRGFISKDSVVSTVLWKR